ncbi:MAG: carbon monoxide dehydrogenase [Acidimicrobiales bacterium]|nr:carbon monoxide dehydrogenase [Acidimicrobiales bacterium]
MISTDGAVLPRTLAAALAVRADDPVRTVVAGGTDLMVGVNAGRLRPSSWLSLRRVPELQRIERHGSSLFVGACVTFARIERELVDTAPALAAAARTVGSVQIRNAATIGGNLSTASPAGDSLPVLACYHAEVEVASVRGTRIVPIGEFLVGPKRTDLGADELVVGVHLRRTTGEQAFAKVGPRAAMVIARCSLAARVDRTTGDAGVGIGAVAPCALAVPAAAEILASGGSVDDFVAAVVSAAAPIDDLRAPAAYRHHALAVLARRMHGWLQ